MVAEVDMNNEALEAKLADAPVGFAVVEGPNMVFTVANARYLEMVSRTDIVGRPWADVFPELVDTPTHAALKSAYDGDRVDVREFSVPIVRGGKLREGFYSFTLDPTRGPEGAIDGVVVIALEVTELVARRRQAEVLAAGLRSSQERYQALFSAMDDGFCLLQMIFDDRGEATDYLFLEANDAFLRHTGLPHPVGKTARELVPELDESWFRLYGKVALTGEPARFENNAPAMGRWFDVFASRVGDPELRQVGLVFKDVSASKRAEQERDALLAAEQAARREAEHANRLKDEFLATVSHELRTPLHAMLGWASLLRSGQLGKEKTEHALETIERNARAQAQLIEDLLDVSRILEGKLQLDVQPTDLRTVVEAALDTVQPAADAKGVSLQARLTSQGTVVGDAQRLQQIVWNLLFNAVKFTPRGGRVQILLQCHDSVVELIVNDTGAGIRPEFVPHVFERFRQGDGGATRLHGGLGLGLSIVRHLTEMHGGSVTAFSEGVDRGARFSVHLPLAATRRAVPAPRRSALREALLTRDVSCPPALHGLKVLVVDDEADSRDVIRALLDRCGLEVTVAASASEALRCFAEERPELLLSDIGMPGEDGLSLITKIRRLPPEAGGETPAVALTAYARAEDRARCLRAGFDHHLPKPVEPMSLLEVVASVAGRCR